MHRLLLSALLLSPVLVGCGFQLRGSQTLPIERLYLALPVNSPIGAEITRVVRSSTNASAVSYTHLTLPTKRIV